MSEVSMGVEAMDMGWRGRMAVEGEKRKRDRESWQLLRWTLLSDYRD